MIHQDIWQQNLAHLDSPWGCLYKHQHGGKTCGSYKTSWIWIMNPMTAKTWFVLQLIGYQLWNSRAIQNENSNRTDMTKHVTRQLTRFQVYQFPIVIPNPSSNRKRWKREYSFSEHIILGDQCLRYRAWFVHHSVKTQLMIIFMQEPHLLIQLYEILFSHQ